MKIILQLLSATMMLCLVVTYAQVKKTPASYKAPATNKMLNTKSISRNSSLSYNKSFRGKETMVVYVIDNKTKRLGKIVLYEAFKNDYRETKLKKYKNKSFLTGYLKGSYELKGSEVIASKGSSLIIIKDKNASLFDKPSPVYIEITKKEQYTGKFEFIPGEIFFPGDEFIILFDGKVGYGRPPMPYRIKVEIIKTDKNQTILKVL